MNEERLYKVLLGPIVSEKTVGVSESNQYVFKVAKTATKLEVKSAVETLWGKEVVAVRTATMKGKTKRTRYGLGVRNDWKKAYIRLAEGQELDFENLAVADK